MGDFKFPVTRRNIKGRPFWSRVWVHASIPTERNALIDARLLRRLMLENNFPQICIPSPENRDLRQLLWHRHRLVQMRTRIMNQLQALAMNEGYRWKKKLFSEQGRAL